jgi:hypothetical protein
MILRGSDYKAVFGVIASLIGLVSSVPYLADILRRKTKPHLFTWLVWGILTSIAFFAQVARQGGAGAWVTGVTALTCFVFTALAVRYGEKDIKPIDWLSLLGALLGLLLWAFTSDPLLAVILITIIDLIGFAPTLRKAYFKPHEETAVFFFLSIWKFGAGLVALGSYNLTTCLFPAAVALFNVIFVTTLLVRRRVLARSMGSKIHAR